MAASNPHSVNGSITSVILLPGSPALPLELCPWAAVFYLKIEEFSLSRIRLEVSCNLEY